MLNQVVLIGRITKDHELKKPGEHSVLNFTIAVDRAFSKNETDFIDCVAWRKTAENMDKYTGKGSLIAVQGRIQVDNYEKDGQKRKSFKVVANDVRFLDKGQSEPHDEVNVGDDEW
jgi:single-strand DNA-binding protein